jgi:hypothetical protein
MTNSTQFNNPFLKHFSRIIEQESNTFQVHSLQIFIYWSWCSIISDINLIFRKPMNSTDK